MERVLTRGFKQGRCLLVRLDHGADIVKQISDLLNKEMIEVAAFCAIGALTEAEIAYYDQVSHEYRKISVNEPVELVSCTGNVSLRDDKPFLHAHAALAFSDGRVTGGHLTSGRVFAAEAFVQELLGDPLIREYDSATGLYLWGQSFPLGGQS
jgi:predicted DNA-binding protein with PD1-like motif